jgi:hypothetical protein
MRPLLVSAALFSLLAGLAAAAPTPQPPPLMFISPSGEPFRQSPATPDPLKAWFDQADARRQGYIDREEFRTDAARFFKRLDENGDGVIDGFEVGDYEHKVVPELAEWAEGRAPGEFAGAKGDHPHEPKQSGSAKRGPAPRAIAQVIYEPEPVSDADFNLDSRITMAEWMEAADRRFDLLDTDKTGRLTLDALRAKLTGPTLIKAK